MRHGLLVGKFYPPHRGHHHAVRTAAARCDLLTVVVAGSSVESIALGDRVAWLRAEHACERNVTIAGIHCDVPSDLDDPAVWAAQVALFAAAARAASPAAPPIDVVFSSERYGDELAARLGAVHEALDPERRAVPLSATQVRADVAGHWDDLAAATRAGLAVRVVLLGGESTGTTTVARSLAERFHARGGVWLRTAMVEEFGREWTVRKWDAAVDAARAAGASPPPLESVAWDHADFDHIAREQTRRENAAAAAGSPLLVCDNDAFAAFVWERRYLGSDARALQPWASTDMPRHDVYLLTDHVGVPYVRDRLRDGDVAARAAMTRWFEDALTGAGQSWALLTGALETRLRLAVEICDALLAHRLTLADPWPMRGGRE